MADVDTKLITTTVRDTQMLPLRRGRIKIRIFKSIVAALSCSGRYKEREDNGEGSYYYYDFSVSDHPLSSTSTTPTAAIQKLGGIFFQ
ncbi:hypothetical protein HN51_054423 [Arachis hypogaea]